MKMNDSYLPFRLPSEAWHLLGLLHLVHGFMFICVGFGFQLTEGFFVETWLGYATGYLFFATVLCSLGVEFEDNFHTAIPVPFACFSTISLIATSWLCTITKLAADKELDVKFFEKTSCLSITSFSTAVMTLAISGILLCAISVCVCCYGCLKQYNMANTSPQKQEFQGQTDEFELTEISIEFMNRPIYFLNRDPNDPQFLDQLTIENEIKQREIPGSPLPERPFSSLSERPSWPVQEIPRSPVQERPGYPSWERPCAPMQERSFSSSMERLSPYKKEYSPPDKPRSHFQLITI